MPNPTDLNQKRLKKLMEEKQHAQDSFCELIKVLQINLKSTELTEHFALKCLECNDLDSVLILLDDFFLGLLKMTWHIHYPIESISNQWAQKISALSEVKARRYISSAIVDKTYEMTQIQPAGNLWLLGTQTMCETIKVLPLGEELLDSGFLALGLDSSSQDLPSQSYRFIREALSLTLKKALAKP